MPEVPRRRLGLYGAIFLTIGRCRGRTVWLSCYPSQVSPCIFSPYILGRTPMVLQTSVICWPSVLRGSSFLPVFLPALLGPPASGSALVGRES